MLTRWEPGEQAIAEEQLPGDTSTISQRGRNQLQMAWLGWCSSPQLKNITYGLATLPIGEGPQGPSRRTAGWKIKPDLFQGLQYHRTYEYFQGHNKVLAVVSMGLSERRKSWMSEDCKGRIEKKMQFLSKSFSHVESTTTSYCVSLARLLVGGTGSGPRGYSRARDVLMAYLE